MMISNETLLKIQEKLSKDPALRAKFTTVLKEIASGIDTISDEELESIFAGNRGKSNVPERAERRADRKIC